MLGPKKTGKTLSTARIKRKQKRRKRRPLEAVDQDWQNWDEAAKLSGLNFAEFARRALNDAMKNVAMAGIFGSSRGDRLLAQAVYEKTAEFLAEKPKKMADGQTAQVYPHRSIADAFAAGGGHVSLGDKKPKKKAGL